MKDASSETCLVTLSTRAPRSTTECTSNKPRCYRNSTHSAPKLPICPLFMSHWKWLLTLRRPSRQRNAENRHRPNKDTLRGPKIDSRVGAGETILGDQRDSMDALLDLFARMKTEQAELFATICAVWNDLLLAGDKPTDADIANELRDNWHESKKRFTTDRIQTCIDWIREQNLTPTGTGEPTTAN